MSKKSLSKEKVIMSFNVMCVNIDKLRTIIIKQSVAGSVKLMMDI